MVRANSRTGDSPGDLANEMDRKLSDYRTEIGRAQARIRSLLEERSATKASALSYAHELSEAWDEPKHRPKVLAALELNKDLAYQRLDEINHTIGVLANRCLVLARIVWLLQADRCCVDDV